ncbi:uncharacterized protein BYT42DRAFT_498946, partial [Radiomyces spectabilis]|uniref:uncharacterized protein n=1 Tax=Radiomyces spectabilis TaxID=64574 RepID=UPI00221EFFD3
VLILLSIAFARYYKDPRVAERLALGVTMASFGVAFVTFILLPLDVLLVSSTVDHKTGLKKLWAEPETIYWMTFAVQLAYYVCYGLTILFCFLVIPFTYFYYDDSVQERPTIREKSLTSLRYTSIFGIIAAVVFMLGLFVRPTDLPPHIDLPWYKNLLAESNGSKAFSFVMACLYVVGTLIAIFYTAPGLSILAFNLIKGKRSIDQENETLEHRLALVMERQRELEAKYANGNHAMSVRDARERQNIDDEIHILTRRLQGVHEDQSSWFQRLLKLLRPFQMLFGFLLLVVSLVMAGSIVLSLIDKITFSMCGRKCGYILTKTDLFNPMDYLFVQVERVFPLDLILVALFGLYYFLSTMAGVVRVGVRFLWITLYRIKQGATTPQGLLLSSSLVILGLLAMNYSLATVMVPSYAHFGSQVYCNFTKGGRRDCAHHFGMIVPCDIYGPTDICTPTVTSTFLDRMTVNAPFFGDMLYYGQWLFLLSFGLGLIVSLFRSPTNTAAENTNDLIDAEEREGLLDGRQHTYGSEASA